MYIEEVLSMEASITTVKDLIDGILERYLPIADNISSLLNPDPVLATKSIVRLLRKSLFEFTKYMPLAMIRTIDTDDSNSYTFKDNYEDYYNGSIDLSQLELVPTAIARCAAGVNWDLTANYWRYQRPTLFGSSGSYMIKAVYDYPIYLKYDDDGLLLPQSHVFGLPTSEYTGMFEDQLDLIFLQAIQYRSELVQLPQSATFFNLNSIIGQLGENVRVNTEASSALSIAWL